MWEKRIPVKEAKSLRGPVEIAGWAHEVRSIGKLKFIILRDSTGKVQVMLKQGIVPDELLSLHINKEDFLYVKGQVVDSKFAQDGVEVIPHSIEILGKVGKKLPVDPAGVVESDFDTRLNYRYIDLRRKEVSDVFRIKSIVSNAFRSFAVQNGFVEIHTPSLVGAATEGGADLFEVEYFERKAYLAQSPQLYKEMAVLGGLEKVFMQVPVFRAEKHNTVTHLNEIIQMDVEMALVDCIGAMDWLEKFFLHICKEAVSSPVGEEYSLAAPKKVMRLTYSEIVDRLNSEGASIEWGRDFTKEEEKKIAEIVGRDAFFIYEWPTEVRAFYSMPKDDRVCNAFDLIYKGLEISSGAQRIHVPELLEAQLSKRGLNPQDFSFFIDAFYYGAPPHSGWSIGLERLVMKLMNLPNIRDAMLFPRDRMRLHP
ncbi:MAG: aspartate--tRNA(Asn) ligase [Candidatus Anstonellales archaeon]